MSIIYILKLQSDKWYVGKTDDFERRIEEHLLGKGCEWTKKYPLTDIDNVVQCSTDPYDEDKFTLKLMAEQGINNVRGGIYCQMELDDSDIENIKRSIRNARNLCLNCGKPGHFINNCKLGCLRCGNGHKTKDCCCPRILPTWDKFKI